MWCIKHTFLCQYKVLFARWLYKPPKAPLDLSQIELNVKLDITLSPKATDNTTALQIAKEGIDWSPQLTEITECDSQAEAGSPRHAYYKRE